MADHDGQPKIRQKMPSVAIVKKSTIADIWQHCMLMFPLTKH